MDFKLAEMHYLPHTPNAGNQANLMLIQPDVELFSQGDLISADDGVGVLSQHHGD